MKKRLLIITLILALLGTPIIALASDISGAKYWAVIQISNNSTATTNVATTANISTTNLIDGGYISASANNCVMRTSSGADVPFMLGYTPDGYPWCIWVPSIGDNGYQSDILYTAPSTGGLIRYFPGAGGMTTPDNDATLEFGDNFTVEQSGWVDTIYLPPIYEDFSTYTEEDDNAKLTVINSKASVGDADRDEDVYLYKDMGADYFDALRVEFEIYVSTDAVNGGAGGVAISNTVNTTVGFGATDLSLTGRRAVGATDFDFHLTRGNDVAADYYAGTTNTLYYCRFEREVGSDTVNLLIFSDGARATLLDTLTVAGFGTVKWQYAFGFINRNTGNAGIDWDGYTQNLNLSPTDKRLVDKAGAFKTYISGTGNITSSITGGGSVTASSLASGEYTVRTMLVSANLTIWIDGDMKDSIASGAVPDTALNWTFVQNGSMLYLERQEIEIGGTLRQHIVWEYDNVFTDLSGNGNDATPTFRTASSDPDVSAELISFQPVAEAKAPDYVLGEAPAFIDPGIIGNVTGTFTTTPGTGTFPLAEVITAIANATATPPQLPLLIIAVFIILAASLSFSYTLRKYGSGSLLGKMLVIIALMGIFVALGNFAIDFWMIVIFAIIAVAIGFMSKQVAFS